MKKYHDALQQHIDEQLAELTRRAADGGCADYPAYREYVGKVKALKSMKVTVGDTFKKDLEDEQ